MIRYPTETERDGNLKEKTNGRQRITGQGGEAKVSDNGWRVSIEGTLRSVVGQRDREVDP